MDYQYSIRELRRVNGYPYTVIYNHNTGEIVDEAFKGLEAGYLVPAWDFEPPFYEVLTLREDLLEVQI